MRIDQDWLRHPATARLMSTLVEAGHQAYFVGGCVRDALLRRSVGDIDVATDATPDEVTRIAGAAGMKVVPTGIDHGTVTVVSDHVGHEVTTFRRDVETDGRRAVVAFSTRLEDDARRRDFTMNAIYADRGGEIVDPLRGLVDLQAGRVRFIDDADARIREDYLRILRFFRFHAWFGDDARGPDAEALAAISANAAGLSTLSRERIGAEIVKLMAAPDPIASVAAMARTGVLDALFGPVETAVLGRLVAAERSHDLAPDPLRRLAALDLPGAAIDGLRLSKRDADRIAGIAAAAQSDGRPAELAYRHGAAMATDAVLLRAARTATAPPERFAADIAEGARRTFPVRARDLQDRFEGPALGAALKRLEDRWIASGFALGREELLAEV